MLLIVHACPASREIASHVKEDFWEIVTEYSEDGGRRCTFKWDRGHLFDHAVATAFYQPCVLSPLATVLAVGASQSPAGPHARRPSVLQLHK